MNQNVILGGLFEPQDIKVPLIQGFIPLQK
jgi:hypothetical protein